MGKDGKLCLERLVDEEHKKNSQPAQVQQGWQTTWPEHEHGGECTARQSCPGTTCRTTFDNSGGVTSEDPLGGAAKEAPEDRSSEPDAEAALVSHQASSSSCRDSILALYGVKMKDACSPSSPKGTMVDLTLDDSSPDV